MTEYKLYISSEEIEAKVHEMARRISADYDGCRPLLITLLKGAFIFLADLVRHLTIPHEIDFVTLSSYREGATRSREVMISKRPSSTLEGRDIIIIDEIVDTGHTLSNLINSIDFSGARSIRICTLLDKRSCREVDVHLDYVGFKIPEVFAVGYGLDFMNHYRNLSYITELTPDLMMIGGPFERQITKGAFTVASKEDIPAIVAGGGGPLSAGKRFKAPPDE